MTDITHSFTSSDLEGNAAWIRSLARRLVRSDEAAQDLAQETWLAALERNPSTGRPLRPWLARVARNLAAKHHARQAHRATVELEDAPGAGNSPEETAETLEQQRLLVELVQALPEPLRTTVVQRYTHGLTAAEIARRQNAPQGTVRWRLKQAIDQLRAELDERNGGERRRWMQALLPLLRVDPAAVHASSVAAVPAPVVLASLAAILLAVAIGLWVGLSSSDSEGPDATTRIDDEIALARSAPDPALAVSAESGERTVVPTANVEPAGASLAGQVEPAAAQGARVSGTLRDQYGAAMGPARLEVRHRVSPRRLDVEADADGAWSLTDLEPGDYVIGARELPAGYVPAFKQWTDRADYADLDEADVVGTVPTPHFTAADFRVDPGATLTGVDLTVYRAAAVTGRVLGPDGEGVPRVEVRLRGLEAWTADLYRDTYTDQNGEFRIDDLWPGSYQLVTTPPQMPGSTVLTQSVYPVLGLFPGDQQEIDVRLGQGSVTVRGQVVDGEGEPFEGLLMVCYRRAGSRAGVFAPDPAGRVDTDAEGRFEFGHMTAGSYNLMVGVNSFVTSAKRGENLTGAWQLPVAFEVAVGQELVELDTITALRSRPFGLAGRLTCSDGSLSMSSIGIEVRYSEVGPFDPEQQVRDRVRSLDVATDGSFSWWCETPHPPLEVHVVDRTGKYSSRILPVTPEPNEDLELEIDYP